MAATTPGRTLLLVLAVVLVAGCGSQSALEQQSTSLKSLAAEGGLVAGNAARGSSTTVFTREHTGFLLKSARSTASALARQTSARGRQLARAAARVTDDLEALQQSGADRAEQRRLQRDLERIAKQL